MVVNSSVPKTIDIDIDIDIILILYNTNRRFCRSDRAVKEAVRKNGQKVREAPLSLAFFQLRFLNSSIPQFPVSRQFGGEPSAAAARQLPDTRDCA